MAKTRDGPDPHQELFRNMGRLLREDPKVIEREFMRARKEWRAKLGPLIRAAGQKDTGDLSLIVR